MKVKRFFQSLLCCLTIGCYKPPKSSKKKQGRDPGVNSSVPDFVGGRKTLFRPSVDIEILYECERVRVVKLENEVRRKIRNQEIICDMLQALKDEADNTNLRFDSKTTVNPERILHLSTKFMNRFYVRKETVAKFHTPSLIVCFGGAIILDTQIQNWKKISNNNFINIIFNIYKWSRKCSITAEKQELGLMM